MRCSAGANEDSGGRLSPDSQPGSGRTPSSGGCPATPPLSVNPPLRICAFPYLRRSGQGVRRPIALIVALPFWGGRRFPLGPPRRAATRVAALTFGEIAGLFSLDNERTSSPGDGAGWLGVWTIITLQIAPSATSGGNSVEVEELSVMRTIPPNRGIGAGLVPVSLGGFAPHVAVQADIKRPRKRPFHVRGTESRHELPLLVGSSRRRRACS